MKNNKHNNTAQCYYNTLRQDCSHFSVVDKTSCIFIWISRPHVLCNVWIYASGALLITISRKGSLKGMKYLIGISLNKISTVKLNKFTRQFLEPMLYSLDQYAKNKMKENRSAKVLWPVSAE